MGASTTTSKAWPETRKATLDRFTPDEAERKLSIPSCVQEIAEAYFGQSDNKLHSRSTDETASFPLVEDYKYAWSCKALVKNISGILGSTEDFYQKTICPHVRLEAERYKMATFDWHRMLTSRRSSDNTEAHCCQPPSVETCGNQPRLMRKPPG